MLQKRRDLGSMPDGLGITATEMTKGTAVVRKVVGGIVKYAKPSTADEAKSVYGFITLRIDDKEGTDKAHDTILANKKAVVYTWVKNNEWATTEFVGTFAVGDKCVIGYTADTNDGKVIPAGAVEPTLEVVAVSPAKVGYEDALITVKVL